VIEHGRADPEAAVIAQETVREGERAAGLAPESSPEAEAGLLGLAGRANLGDRDDEVGRVAFDQVPRIAGQPMLDPLGDARGTEATGPARCACGAVGPTL
jgi:hypothetical protein